eukprot:CAMPEP_0197844544 /NCGR_PEP_ID=MMETSP1438-20131217/1524_1 /TAXON_ID=1461541 /ORGANISM="Pterosperma sp., Strain CCMP1384" /LENGTH=67 /DNA_ID=CAMNT_0043455377 /DNA_START=105 /DNA_END=308 /DNA_ORIENTATION=-
MTTSKRFANAKSEKFAQNVHKRGNIVLGTRNKDQLGVGPVMIGFFVFVVIGSSVFQIIRTATSGGIA